MGKQRFKLSDLMPNSWFYKLKDMSKSNRNPNSSVTTKRNYDTRTIPTTPKPIPNRASYYSSTHERLDKFPIKINPKAIDIHFPNDPPKKITQNPTKTPINPSVLPPYERDVYTEEDIIKNFDEFEDSKPNSEVKIKLRPIKTKGLETEDFEDQPSSPRIRSRRLRVYKTRNPLLSGFAVMKASLDPQRDFRESMIEMISENGIRKAKDLEELLSCYLTLNTVEYHKMIVRVFEEVWIELDC
ncbi:hypothetical protein LUZ60_003905 [Juncus effusus]|nr:hypothetical protein LUZ60_003905 [Juncus effusus]